MQPEDAAKANVVLTQILISMIIIIWVAGLFFLWWLEDRLCREQSQPAPPATTESDARCEHPWECLGCARVVRLDEDDCCQTCGRELPEECPRCEWRVPEE